MFGERRVGVVVELEARRAEPAARREVEVLRVVGLGVLDRDQLPRLRLVNVQVTVSPAFTTMLDTGLPSSQVALVWSHPLGTVSAIEYVPA